MALKSREIEQAAPVQKESELSRLVPKPVARIAPISAETLAALENTAKSLNAALVGEPIPGAKPARFADKLPKYGGHKHEMEFFATNFGYALTGIKQA